MTSHENACTWFSIFSKKKFFENYFEFSSFFAKIDRARGGGIYIFIYLVEGNKCPFFFWLIFVSIKKKRTFISLKTILIKLSSQLQNQCKLFFQSCFICWFLIFVTTYNHTHIVGALIYVRKKRISFCYIVSWIP